MKTVRTFILFGIIAILLRAFITWDVSFLWGTFQTEEGRKDLLFNIFWYALAAILYTKFEKKIERLLNP